MTMKQKWTIHRQGIEWGAAHEEAQPVTLQHGQTIIAECYRKEGGDYALTLPDDAKIELRDGRLYVVIPAAG